VEERAEPLHAALALTRSVFKLMRALFARAVLRTVRDRNMNQRHDIVPHYLALYVSAAALSVRGTVWGWGCACRVCACVCIDIELHCGRG
jgi:hypothetical protein